MELNKYDTIKNLNGSTYNWQTRVRLQYTWKGINRQTQEYYGINMIFIDDSNSRIHGFASKKYCEELFEKLVEGQIYCFSNFKVKKYVGDEIFRPVRNEHHIYFTPHTKIEKDANDGLQIDDYAFDLFYMEEIEKLADDNRFLIDMVGKVENIEETIRTNKNNRETIRLKFDLSDGRFRVKVTFFDSLAIETEEAFKKLDVANIFVIISCAKVGRFEGAPNLTNYPATRVFINPNHYSLVELKEKWDKHPTLDVSKTDEDIPQKLLTVKEIRNQKNQTVVNCQVTVKKVDEKQNWYYAQCIDCEIEIIRDKGIYSCTKCPRIFPYPEKRFRLCTICSDETGSMVVIFPDSEVTRFIEKTVVDIHSECLKEEDEENFPKILRTFVNQKYTIKLQITEDNINKGSTVYEAKEIMESHDITDSFDPQEENEMEIRDQSQLKDLEEEDTKNETPQTGNSSNMKKRERTNVQPILYDGNEDVEVKALKTIKKEKK
ncbi:DUF223 domain-containing protein [Heracleum sosnowskyi]|uniref:DUF223 domain-containing protein n=1 Tax=Heracleum sosnowskyi TaxID=360622 RepID=A0AAD8I284_9APIA|nr:DUF223 domain-containing protein [Heracleum sosnowskyi]